MHGEAHSDQLLPKTRETDVLVQRLFRVSVVQPTSSGQLLVAWDAFSSVLWTASNGMHLMVCT